LLDLPARDRGRVPDAGGAGAAEAGGLEARAWLERALEQLRAPHPVEAEALLGVAVAIPRVDVPVRERALELVRLDRPRRRLALALLQVLDLDEAVGRDRVGEEHDQALLLRPLVRRRGLRELELAERLLELPADAVERGVRAGRDHRADELEREPDRARLERRQPRRPAEGVAEELLLDLHLVVVQLGVDRVAAAAEVDEVQQRQ